MHYKKTVLDNGITVITEHMDSVRSIALGIFFQVGSRDEMPAEAGMSHFMEHMMFKGTPSLTARELSEAFDRLGARQNAFTSKEVTCYYASFIDESLEGVFGLLSDMVMNASLEQEGCELERRVVIEEIARMEDDPEDVAHELFSATAWPSHPLGLSIAGTRESVGSFNHDDAVAYRSKHYSGDNCIITAAGNVDHDVLVELVVRHMSDLKSHGTQHPRTAPGPVSATTLFQYKDTEQAHILYGTSTMSASDDDRFALGLANTILGGGMSSRLFQEVREKLGLVYAIYSFPQLYQDSGLFAIYAGTRPENASQVYSIVAEEVRKMAAGEITADELELARQASKGGLALSLESTSKRMIRLAEGFMSKGEILSFDESIARLNGVTLDDVCMVSAKLGESETVLAVVGPFKNNDFTLSEQGSGVND